MGISIKISEDIDGLIIGEFIVDCIDLEADDLFTSELDNKTKLDILKETIFNLLGVKESTK